MSARKLRARIEALDAQTAADRAALRSAIDQMWFAMQRLSAAVGNPRHVDMPAASTDLGVDDCPPFGMLRPPRFVR